MSAVSNKINTNTSNKNKSTQSKSNQSTQVNPFEERVLMTALRFLSPHLIPVIMSLSWLTWQEKKLMATAPVGTLAHLSGYKETKTKEAIKELLKKNVFIQHNESKFRVPRIMSINLNVDSWKITGEPQVINKNFYDYMNTPEKIQEIKEKGFLFTCFVPIPQQVIRAAMLTLQPRDITIILGIASETWRNQKEKARVPIDQLATMLNELPIKIQGRLNKLIENNIIIKETKGNSIFLKINRDFFTWNLKKSVHKKILQDSYLNWKPKKKQNRKPKKRLEATNNQTTVDPDATEQNTQNQDNLLDHFNQFIRLLEQEIENNPALSTYLEKIGKNPIVKTSNGDADSNEMNTQFAPFIYYLLNNYIITPLYPPLQKQEEQIRQPERKEGQNNNNKLFTNNDSNPQEPVATKKENEKAQIKKQTEIQDVQDLQEQRDKQLAKTQEELELQKQQAEREKQQAEENQTWINQVQVIWNKAVDDSKNIHSFKGLIGSKSPTDDVKVAILKLRTGFNLAEIEGIFGQMASSFWLCGMSSKFQAWICWGTDFNNCLEYYDRWQSKLEETAQDKEAEARRFQAEKQTRARKLEEEQRRKAASEKWETEQRELEEKRKAYPKIPEWSQILDKLESTINPYHYSQIKKFVVGSKWVGNDNTLKFYMSDGFAKMVFVDELAKYLLKYTSAKRLEYHVEGEEEKRAKIAEDQRKKDEVEAKRKEAEAEKEKELRAKYPQIPEWSRILAVLKTKLHVDYYPKLVNSVLGAKWVGPGKTLKLFLTDSFAKEFFIDHYEKGVLQYSEAESLEYYFRGQEAYFKEKEKADKARAEREAAAKKPESKYSHERFWEIVVEGFETQLPKEAYERFKNDVIGSYFGDGGRVLKLIVTHEPVISFFKEHYEKLIMKELVVRKIEYYLGD